MKISTRLKVHLQRKFFAGTLAAIPLAVTGFILWWVDSNARGLFAVDYPLLGIVVTVLGIYALGVFVTSLLGKYFLGLADWVLNRLPGFRDLYKTWKQIAVTPDNGDGIFAHVVLIPDETGRMRMMGFTSGKAIEGSADIVCTFVPASPNPTSGRLYFVPRSSCRFLQLGTQEALKFVISGGNYVPAAIGRALSES